MIIRVGPLVITRFVVVDFPVAWNGSVMLAWGLVPAAATAIIVILRIVPTFFNVVTRLVHRVCISSLSTTRSAMLVGDAALRHHVLRLFCRTEIYRLA